MSTAGSLHSAVRREVLAACVRLADRGFLAGTGGNVSLRAGPGQFAVTPSGVDYYSMGEEDICILEIDTLGIVDGGLRPSVESGLHAAVLRRRADVTAVVHTHQPLASAVALLHVPIPVTDESARHWLGARIETVPYAPSGTRLLARALRKRLRPDANAYLLRNHGLVCCGPTLEAAMQAVEAAERAAADFLRRALPSNADPDLAAWAQAALN